MPTALLTPYDRGRAVELGRRVYRKQILPVGAITHQGRRLDFSRDYLKRLARGFRDRAYDMVGVVMADGDNRHTLDPERLRGEVKGLELTDDGLDAVLELGDDAAKVVDQHPQVGVSARIVRNLTRADGRAWPDALQHVLITTDPRVTGMRPWQAVEAASDVDEVVDLTAGTYEGDNMPHQLSDEDRQAIARDVAALIRDGQDGPQDGGQAPTQPTTPAGPPQPASVPQGPAGDDDGNLTDAELDRLIAEMAAEDEPNPAAAGAALANDDVAAVELASVREENATLRSQFERERNDRAADRWQTETREWGREGVTPAVLDLAAPYLSAADDHVINLANGSEGNVTETFRRILRLIADDRARIDLSVERGHGFDRPSDAETLDAMNAQLDAEYGV